MLNCSAPEPCSLAAPELQIFAVAAYKYVISVDVALRRTSACPRQLSCSTGVGGMESQP